MQDGMPAPVPCTQNHILRHIYSCSLDIFKHVYTFLGATDNYVALPLKSFCSLIDKSSRCWSNAQKPKVTHMPQCSFKTHTELPFAGENITHFTHCIKPQIACLNDAIPLTASVRECNQLGNVTWMHFSVPFLEDYDPKKAN